MLSSSCARKLLEILYVFYFQRMQKRMIKSISSKKQKIYIFIKNFEDSESAIERLKKLETSLNRQSSLNEFLMAFSRQIFNPNT